MARFASDGYIDGGLDAIAGATKLTVCSGQPADIADITARKLAESAITGVDFVKADGTPNGRQTTIAQQVDLPITASGNADHVVVDDGTDFYVTTATFQALTSGGTVTVNSWTITIADPTA